MNAPRTAWLAVLCLAACGPTDDAVTARAPARSGTVWQVDAAANRDAAPAALLAYIHGLHVVLLDGDRAYAGMTRLESVPGPDGERVFSLGNGITASVVANGPADDGFELRFSSGERIALTRREGS